MASDNLGAFATGWMIADVLGLGKQKGNDHNNDHNQRPRKNKTFRIGSMFGSAKEGAFSAIVDQLIDGDTVEFTSDIIDAVSLTMMVTIKGNGHRFITKPGTQGIALHNLCTMYGVHFEVSEKSNGINLHEPDLELYLDGCTFDHPSKVDVYPSIHMQFPLKRLMCAQVVIDQAVLNTRMIQATTLQLGNMAFARSGLYVSENKQFTATHAEIQQLVLINGALGAQGGIDELKTIRSWVSSYGHQLQIKTFSLETDALLAAENLEKVETGLTIANSIQIDRVMSPKNPSDALLTLLKKHVQLFKIKADQESHITLSGQWDFANAWGNQILSGNVDFVNYTDQTLWTFHQEESRITWKNGHFKYRKKYTPKPKVKTAQEKLNEMIGLNDVKKKVNAYIATNLVNQKRQELGQPVSANSLHLIFSGSAGTGKTQVARLLATILYENGIITKPDIKEAMGKDLIGEYTGQTSPKTHNLIMEAKGGILFIDEAYELDPSSGGSDGYKREALTTLVKDMDDLRSELIVIMAGYTEQMRHLLKANDGLPSRFVNVVEFPDYTADELVAIAQLQLSQLKQTLTPDASQQLTTYIREAKQNDRVDGNGRWVRNLLQFISQARDVRIVADGSMQTDPAAINQITVADVTEGIANF